MSLLSPSIVFWCRNFFLKVKQSPPSHVSLVYPLSLQRCNPFLHKRPQFLFDLNLGRRIFCVKTNRARNWEELKKSSKTVRFESSVISCLLMFAILSFLFTQAHAQQAVLDLSSQSASSGESRDGLETLYKGSYALVIGASKYSNGWNSLVSIPREVEGIAKALEKLNFAVEILHDPSGEELKKKVQEFFHAYGAEKNNRLVVYFGGHGYTIHEENDLKSSDTGFLVPVDAPLPFVEKQAFIDVALNMDLLKRWSKEVACKHLLFLFDSCFSGAILQTRSLKFQPRLLENVLDKPVRLFITAGSANQEVPAESLFARAFIKALQGEGDVDKDGFMTGAELGYFINKTVMMSSPNTSPQVGKLHEGDFDKGDILFKLDPSIAMIPKPIEKIGVQNEPPKKEATKQGLSNYIP